MFKLWGSGFCPHKDCRTPHREWKSSFWIPHTYTHTHHHHTSPAWFVYVCVCLRVCVYLFECEVSVLLGDEVVHGDDIYQPSTLTILTLRRREGELLSWPVDLREPERNLTDIINTHTRTHTHKDTKAVSQITYFCTKHLTFWVQKCAKCVHTEKYAKMQCTTRTLKTVQKLCVEW